MTESPAPEPEPSPEPPPVPAARTGEQDDAPAARRTPRTRGQTKGQAKARAQARARARAKGLIAAPVLPRGDGDDPAEDDAPSRPELTEERIDELLAKLADSETTPDAASLFGPLGALHGRAGGLALPIVLGVGLLLAGVVVVGIVGLIF